MAFHLTHRPSPGNMLLGFGPRPKPTPTSPATHYGQDYGHGNGLQVYAAASGRVKSYARAGAYGNRMVIDHGNGIETWYCHLSGASVKEGSWVSGGQRVATQGNTGNALGVHLHFELRINGVAVDPAPYFSTQPAADDIEEITPEEEEEEMAKNVGIYYERKNPATGKVSVVYNIHNTVSGFEHEFSNGEGNGPMPSAYNNALATAYGTPSWAKVTEGHANVIKRALAEIRDKA